MLLRKQEQLIGIVLGLPRRLETQVEIALEMQRHRQRIGVAAFVGQIHRAADPLTCGIDMPLLPCRMAGNADRNDEIGCCRDRLGVEHRRKPCKVIFNSDQVARVKPLLHLRVVGEKQVTWTPFLQGDFEDLLCEGGPRSHSRR